MDVVRVTILLLMTLLTGEYNFLVTSLTGNYRIFVGIMDVIMNANLLLTFSTSHFKCYY